MEQKPTTLLKTYTVTQGFIDTKGIRVSQDELDALLHYLDWLRSEKYGTYEVIKNTNGGFIDIVKSSRTRHVHKTV